MNILSSPLTAPACGACKDGSETPFGFTMAFQPIVDTANHTVYSYEALVRGRQGESAHSVLSQVTEQNRYAFDQGCRVKAITLAAELGVHHRGARLSVNFMPGAVYSPASCIQRTLRAARETGFPMELLTFEVTEDERVRDTGHLQGIVSEYKKHGFKVALDDFGAGFSGLALLAELEVDSVKVDLQLVRDVPRRRRAALIVGSVAGLCRDLNVQVIAEGVETVEEYEELRSFGITHMQGYLFAKPMFEGLPEISWPDRNLRSDRSLVARRMPALSSPAA